MAAQDEGRPAESFPELGVPGQRAQRVAGARQRTRGRELGQTEVAGDCRRMTPPEWSVASNWRFCAWKADATSAVHIRGTHLPAIAPSAAARRVRAGWRAGAPRCVAQACPNCKGPATAAWPARPRPWILTAVAAGPRRMVCQEILEIRTQETPQEISVILVLRYRTPCVK